MSSGRMARGDHRRHNTHRPQFCEAIARQNVRLLDEGGSIISAAMWSAQSLSLKLSSCILEISVYEVVQARSTFRIYWHRLRATGRKQTVDQTAVYHVHLHNRRLAGAKRHRHA